MFAAFRIVQSRLHERAVNVRDNRIKTTFTTKHRHARAYPLHPLDKHPPSLGI